MAELEGPENRRKQRVFRLVTNLQVTGGRYLRRRLRHALVRRDTRMIDDPQKFQSSPLVLGIIFAVVVLAGCFGMGLINPAGLLKDAKIIAAKDSTAKYVRIGNTLNPVLNLTSARLIVGSPMDPIQASAAEIAKLPRGSIVGIAGAPDDIRDSDDPLSAWTVCDETATGSAVPLDPVSGLPTTAVSPVKTTVIGGPLAHSSEVQSLSDNSARLVGRDGQTWLVYPRPDGVVVRSTVNITDPVVADALGLHADDLVLPISPGLFNAIPAEPPLVSPQIANVGTPPAFKFSRPLAVGTIMKVTDLAGKTSFYVVVGDGVQEVGQAAATMIRASNPQVGTEPIAIGPDELATYPKAHQLAVGYYPNGRVQLVSAAHEPVTCWSWTHQGSDPTARTEVVVGRTLPLTPAQVASRVRLIAALDPALKGRVADYASMPTNTGRFVEVTGNSPDSRTRTGYFWVADTGVRYGLDNTGDEGDKTFSALRLSHPVPAPWVVINLFSPGATLSRRDALRAYDGLPEAQTVLGINPKDVEGK